MRSSSAQAQPDAAPMTEVQTAGVKRVKEMIEALNSGDYATIRAYFDAQSDPNGFVNALGQYRLSRGFDLVRVELVPNRADLFAGIVRNRITGDEGYLAVRIEPQAPYRITLFQARVTPDEVVASWKLKLVTSTAVTEEERLQEIGAYLKRMGDADLFWGTIVIARDGKPVFAQAYGYADREKKIPNTVDTPFFIGSLTKLFTGLAIGQLVEQGKLSYDDPLSKFLPDFPDPESAKKIRIKHLLSHTSGLAREGSPIGSSSIDHPTTVKAMVDAFERKPLAFEPGTKACLQQHGLRAAWPRDRDRHRPGLLRLRAEERVRAGWSAERPVSPSTEKWRAGRADGISVRIGIWIARIDCRFKASLGRAAGAAAPRVTRSFRHSISSSFRMR